ncbi:MAG: hypothetical protein IJS39_14835 [Synergistaceae bacterium]|nr:hypothetical protein [Synergistaceae bacterium]
MTKEYFLAEYFALAEKLGVSPEALCGIIVLAVFIILYAGHGLAFFRFLMRWLQRIIVFAGLCALGFWMLYIGREHQIFLDNKTLGEFKALEQVNVSINGQKPVELMTRERDVKKATGPTFVLRAEVFDEDGNLVNSITRTIEPKFSKDIMINLPALIGGADNFILPAPR